MSYLGFSGEFARQAKLAGLTQKVRNTFDRAVQEGTEHIDYAQKKLDNGVEQASKAYENRYGPLAADSPQDRVDHYNAFMSNIKSQADKKMSGVLQNEGAAMADKQKQVESTLARLGRNSGDYYSADDMAGVMNAGWGTGEMQTGVMDIFNKTADARATALGITRFRGTDGAMSTLGSIGSLLYEDNACLSKGAAIAGTLGGVAVAGMAAGKVIGAGLDDTLADRD